jgi:hypothetical protein
MRIFSGRPTLPAPDLQVKLAERHRTAYDSATPPRSPVRFASPDSPSLPEPEMVQITYRIVEHDGGWAYKLGETFSETFATHDAARAAAVAASREQKVSDEDAFIEYEDADGRWITERADGHDRPETTVEG